MGSAREAKGGTVVLGGGFAGASVARELGRAGCTIVSPNEDLVYTPLLPEAAAGEVELGHLAVSLRSACPHAQLLRGRATHVDRDAQTVTVQVEGQDATELRYEHLVVAVGSVVQLPPVPGLRERALGVKTIPDVRATRDHVLARLAAAAAEQDPERRQCELTFLVVGGGYAGVETLAALQALVRDAGRDHPGLRGELQRWVLVDAAAAILSDLPGRLGEYAAEELAGRGVEIVTSTTLVAVEDGRAVLSDGTVLETATVIWTAGVGPNPLVATLGLPVDDTGRLRLWPTLQVEGEGAIWAAGDCAAVPNAATPGRTDPPTSQHALRQARRIARNIAAVRAGRAPESYRFLQLGQVATLGRYHGVADVFGLHLSGLPGWLAARTVHLMQYPDPLGRLAIVNDWTLSLLLRRNTRTSAGERAVADDGV